MKKRAVFQLEGLPMKFSCMERTPAKAMFPRRWSCGVVPYEIFTIGGSPYPRMDGRNITNLLQEGKPMPKPQHVDDKLKAWPSKT